MIPSMDAAMPLLFITFLAASLQAPFGQGGTPPRDIPPVQADYPPEALRNGWEGMSSWI